MIARTIVALLAIVGLVQSAHAAPMPAANKLIALVRSANCDFAHLAPRLDATGKSMADDRRTVRVGIDKPADPLRNLDLMGRPSPFAGAVEVGAAARDLPKLARRIKHSLGKGCRVDIYFVRERRLQTTTRSWPLGLPSPTSKTLVTLTRKHDLLRENFNREWSGPHAELALAWRAERGGSGHYVQNLVIDKLGSDTPPLDGIGESEGPGTPSPEEIAARVKTAAHARTFQALESSAMFVALEVILKD